MRTPKNFLLVRGFFHTSVVTSQKLDARERQLGCVGRRENSSFASIDHTQQTKDTHGHNPISLRTRNTNQQESKLAKDSTNIISKPSTTLQPSSIYPAHSLIETSFMSTATSPGSGANAGGSHAQFWEDFWNTLYQFTHPFSSTFFDTVFFSQDSSSSSSSQQQEQQKQQQPPTADKPSSSRFFKDEASFQKFWQGLQNGSPDGNSSSGTGSGSLVDHLQTAWVDFKSASSGFIQAVS